MIATDHAPRRTVAVRLRGLPARPCRLSPAALGRLSDNELAFLADCSATPSTRAAALLVLVGRATAADVLAATDNDTE